MSTARTETTLWLAQRATAILLALLVTVHLATMIYAVRGGLSAGEILARTRGSVGWGVFYGLFVVAAAIHAPIGLRAILNEWASWRGRSADLFVLAFGLVLLVLGLRAVWGVTT